MKLSHTIDKPILDRYGSFLGVGISIGTLFFIQPGFLSNYPMCSFVMLSLSILFLVLTTLRMFYIQYKYKKEISLMALMLCAVWVFLYIFYILENPTLWG